MPTNPALLGPLPARRRIVDKAAGTAATKWVLAASGPESFSAAVARCAAQFAMCGSVLAVLGPRRLLATSQRRNAAGMAVETYHLDWDNQADLWPDCDCAARVNPCAHAAAAFAAQWGTPACPHCGGTARIAAFAGSPGQGAAHCTALRCGWQAEFTPVEVVAALAEGMDMTALLVTIYARQTAPPPGPERARRAAAAMSALYD